MRLGVSRKGELEEMGAGGWASDQKRSRVLGPGCEKGRGGYDMEKFCFLAHNGRRPEREWKLTLERYCEGYGSL